MASARFRFYGELNDFLAVARREVEFLYEFHGKPAVKDAIEACGPPHPETNGVRINGNWVGLDAHLRQEDRVDVYPARFEIDDPEFRPLIPNHTVAPSFVLDVHLGKLAWWLRLLGFDTLYRDDFDDPELVNISVRESRILLTRDIGLLKNSAVALGRWMRATDPDAQIREAIQRYDLRPAIRPFRRCVACNGLIEEEPSKEAALRAPLKTRERCNHYYGCQSCGRLYWKGTHYEAMSEAVEDLLREYEP